MREGRHYRHGPEPEPGEISSELENPEHNDSERGRHTEGREGGKQTGKREIMCRLIGPGAREPGESRDPGRVRRLSIGHSCESRHGG